jgi:hypothetical protein
VVPGDRPFPRAIDRGRSLVLAGPDHVWKRRLEAAWLPILLAAFAATAYGLALGLPFIGDDYVFLDKTRDAGFADLWSFANADFQWYRPWSRELHFWVLQRVAGLNETAFRAFGVLLWIVALCLYALVVRRLATTTVAMLATAGVASLALWGAPLLWISGGQDLWMLCFAMGSLLAFLAGRSGWALLLFGLGLLSKETAAVLPALLGACVILLERRRWRDAARRTAPFWALLIVWLVVHPTLQVRLLSGQRATQELEYRPPLHVIVSKTALSVVNLDAVPRPHGIGGVDGFRLLASALAIAAVAAIATRRRNRADPGARIPAGRGSLTWFALVWMAVGWFPLILPSIAWHAYYGCLGVLGAWLALALWLQRWPRIAVAVVLGLALLRGARASTPSWDWGNEWYQRRAGNLLSSIRDELLRQHPSLPAHSRVFLARVPNNIGLIAGQSPALRVWYRDSTLQAGFYSSYRARPEGAARGEDFFFRLDTLRGVVEIAAGPEDVQLGASSNPEWESDHEKLAVLFLRGGDVPRAATEFEKLSALPHRPDAAGFAAVCWETAGDSARAESLIVEAGKRMQLPASELREWVKTLRESFPGR